MHSFENTLIHTKLLSVLFVEDNPEVRESMAAILSILCDKVITAKDGEEGQEKFHRYYQENQCFIDLVISDMIMPRCDGITMSREIRKTNPEQEIVIISARDNSSELIEIINLGINHFLLKPIQEEHLFNTLFRIGKRLSLIRERESMIQKINILNAQLHEKIEVLEKLTREDSLTKVANRRHFYEKAEHLLQKSKTNHTPLTIAVMDIDLFKQINDTYGHLIGDQVIKRTARILSDITQEHIFLGRVGGDEFMMLFESLPDHTILENMQYVQDRIAQGMKIHNTDIHYTISIGISSLQPEDTTLDDIIHRADLNLYKAKKHGRNRIVFC